MTIDEIDKLTDDLYMEWLSYRHSDPRDLRREIFLAGHAIAASGLAECALSAHEWKVRAEKAEAIVELARAVERGWGDCNRMQNECQTDGWTGPKLLALEEARQVHMVATDALQAALAKAGGK